jgi:hypothetical protein
MGKRHFRPRYRRFPQIARLWEADRSEESIWRQGFLETLAMLHDEVGRMTDIVPPPEMRAELKAEIDALAFTSMVSHVYR